MGTSGSTGFHQRQADFESVVDVESNAACMSLGLPHRVNYRQPYNPATILFDFDVASPSLDQAFLRLALHHADVPLHILRAIIKLYRNNKHFWRYHGKVMKQVFIASNRGALLARLVRPRPRSLPPRFDLPHRPLQSL